mgnify:CR=1 FL=1
MSEARSQITSEKLSRRQYKHNLVFMKERFLKLMHDAIVAKMHYQVYDVLTNDVDRPNFVDTMNEYGGFWSSSISAHFVAMVMAISKIYDKKYFSLVHLLEGLQKERLLNSENASILREEVDIIQASLKKVTILRGNFVAHLTEKLSPTEVFKLAAISRNELRRLIDDSFRLLNQIRESLGEPDIVVADNAEEDTRLILSRLREIRHLTSNI